MPDPIPTPVDTADRCAPQAATAARSVLPRVALAMAVSGTLLWATWATHTILNLRDTHVRLVKVELADLVREYVQREARSGEPPEEITARTATFLKALNSAVSADARRGDVVLLGNAVVDGDVPDITAQVRAAVYAHAPRGPESKEVDHGDNH
jgi:hypothetical protein